MEPDGSNRWRIPVNFADKFKIKRFFRNLLLGEQNELRNRYLLINLSADDMAAPTTTTEQAPNKSGTLQVTENDKLIISSIGNDQYTLKQLMEKMGLRHRPTFVGNYLVPSVESGIVRLLFPDKPRHPRQKYLLTAKGLTLYQELNKKE